MPNVDVSFLIVSYNVRDLLGACLASIQQRTHGLTFEVILVDSASGDGTVEFVKQNFPEVNVIACSENVGFPKGNNIAYEKSNGRYIFMLNPDAELVTNAALELKEFLETHDDGGLVAPKLLNTDGSVQRSVQRFITLKEIAAEVFFLHGWLQQNESYLKQPVTKALEVEALSGAAIMCKRELINRIGFLDENLFWTEDMDFSLRSHKAGFKNYYVPHALVTHHVGQSGKKNYDVMISRQVLTKINFFRKHGSAFEYRAVQAARFAQVVSRIALFGILSPFGRRFRDKFNAYRHTFALFITHRY